jgi:hypothetical protein
MSGPLPDNLSQWPESPFELLGVPLGTPARELRRAYTRLIRTYKPEQYPEEFRRIREAYESALRFADLFTLDEGEADSSQPEEAPASPPSEAASADGTVIVPSAPHADVSAEASAPPSREDGPEEFWQLALAGEEARAYRGLVAWTVRHPGWRDAILRLYWLLRLSPSLDATRSPCDWLVEGLCAGRLGGPLRELYRRELADRPAEALTARCDRLLDCPADTAVLADLVEGRWQALVQGGAWDRLAADLEALRPRIARDDERAWVRLLAGLAGELLWQAGAEPAQLLETCAAEIAGHQHLALDLPDVFDRLEYLLDTAEGWKAVRDDRRLPTDLLRLIPLSWSRPFPEVRPLLLAVLGQISVNPHDWVTHLDRLNVRASAVLALFGGLLDQLRHWTEWRPTDVSDRPEVIGPILDLLARPALSDPSRAREALLNFCLHEAVPPDQVAQVGLAHPDVQNQAVVEFCQRATEDWPLRYVCLAHELFWA